jgi:hypothetical protein
MKPRSLDDGVILSGVHSDFSRWLGTSLIVWPNMPLAMLSACLWDLRSLCEQQVRALTDAQRQLDMFRGELDPAAHDAALTALRADLARVVEANSEVRLAARDAAEQAGSLAPASPKPPR